MSQPAFFTARTTSGLIVSINASTVVLLGPTPGGTGTIVEFVSGKSLTLENKIEDLVPGYPKPEAPKAAVDLPADRSEVKQ